jgi:hypothetical protein
MLVKDLSLMTKTKVLAFLAYQLAARLVFLTILLMVISIFAKNAFQVLS